MPADGLTHYRHIAMHAKQHLSVNGHVDFEHGWQQGQAICQLLGELGYSAITQHYDAAPHGERGHPRMIVARLGASSAAPAPKQQSADHTVSPNPVARSPCACTRGGIG